jgi:uncharacterized protein YdaU (DUF1376 family)
LNYYERHIGDYLKDTAHLSLLEHGIYGRLLDIYYTREEPIPEAQVMRLVGARSDEERTSVRDVLNEFFNREGDVWRHNRCDYEIERYQDKQRKAKASADARWSKEKPQTDRNADAMRTHSEGNAPSNQTPVINTPLPPKGGEGSPVVPCPYAEIVKAYHDELPALPSVRVMDAKRQRAMRQRWAWVLSSTKGDGSRRATNAAEALAWFRDYFARVRANAWLMGESPSKGHENWTADLDYLMTDRGLKAVIERTKVAA